MAASAKIDPRPCYAGAMQTVSAWEVRSVCDIAKQHKTSRERDSQTEPLPLPISAFCFLISPFCRVHTHGSADLESLGATPSNQRFLRAMVLRAPNNARRQF